MPLSNADIASQLQQLAELLRNQGVNRFKVKAYRTAADAIRSHPERISTAVKRNGAAPRIPGVGASIGSAVIEIVRSGGLASVRKLEEKLPPGTAAIAAAAHIPLRDAKRLATALKISTAKQLRVRLDAGEVRAAVGPRLEFMVRTGLSDIRRLLWDDARDLSEHFGSALRGVKGAVRVEPAGSLRRGQDTVGTLRFVVQGARTTDLRKMLRVHGGVEAVTELAESRVVCKLAAGPRLVVRVTDAGGLGTALVEETGSGAHLRDVRTLARRRVPRESGSEDEWYRRRGMRWVPPELREGRGEVEAAIAGTLPTLIELGQIRGDLHAHTTASDGANTLPEMVSGARARGYEYLAITDHSKSLAITNGLDEARLRQQMDAIDKLNARLRGFRVLKGSEVDILHDGSLDFADSVLRRLDIVMGSIHSRFALSREQQTERLIRAIKNPYLTCLGHLTGRKLLKRPGYEIDLERVLKAVKRAGKLLEINASPDRLDIDDTVAHRARDLGIPLLINTDAHSVREFNFMAFGVQQARRGWQTSATVFNTLPLRQLMLRIKGTRAPTGG